MNEFGTPQPDFDEADTDLGIKENFEQENPPDRVTSHQSGRIFVLPAEGSVTLGRASGEGAAEQRRVSVSSSEHVSREHLNLFIDKDGLTIFDKGSTNGTWLNGERLPNTHSESDMGWKPYNVKVGDLLVIAGNVFYRVKQEQGRWELQQEIPPAQKVAEKVLDNRDHVRVGFDAFEAIPFSTSLAEFLSYAEMSLPFVLQEQDDEALKKALDRLKVGLQTLIGERRDVEVTRDIAPEHILLSAVQELVLSRDQKWKQFLDAAKPVINRERSERNLEPLSFDVYREPLANVWKKNGNENTSASESEKEPSFLVGESLYNKDGWNTSRKNQDAVFSLPSGAAGVFDGMSSAYDGAAAAEITRDTYKEVLSELPPEPTSEQVQKAYQLAMTLSVFRMQEYRNALSASADQDYMDWRAENMTKGPGYEQPILGTTAAVAMIVQEASRRKLVYTYSGDSRVYVLKKSGEARCITLDQNTFALGYRVPEGMTPEQLQERFDNVKDESELANEPELLELYKLRNVVTQDISDATFGGVGANTGAYALEADDVGFFCTTDGIHDNLTKDEIEETMKSDVNDTQEMPAVREEQLTIPQKMRRRLNGMLTGLQSLQKRFGKERALAKPELSEDTLRKRVKDIADRAYDVSQLPVSSNNRAKRDDVALAYSISRAA